MEKEQQQSIGALWKKTSANGNEYMSGKIKVGNEEVSIVCFINKSKTEDKHPDYKVYKSKPKGE